MVLPLVGTVVVLRMSQEGLPATARGQAAAGKGHELGGLWCVLPHGRPRSRNGTLLYTTLLG